MIVTCWTILTTLTINSYSFASKSPRDADLSFVALGDWGCSSWSSRISQMIEEINPKLVLGLGDYDFNNSSACFFDMIKPFDNIMKIAFGPHDVTLSLLHDYIDHFNLKKQYYSYNYRNVHFTVISTEIPFKRYSPQYDFVNKDLAKASKDRAIDWIIVYYHKPAYTSAIYDTKKAASIRDTYHHLFQKYSVDLVLQAHNHYYERTYPLIYNPIDSSNPGKSNSNFYYYDNPEGPIFVTVGTGGGDTHIYNGQREYVADYYLGRGFLEVKISSNGKELSGEFYSLEYDFTDKFIIKKSRTN